MVPKTLVLIPTYSELEILDPYLAEFGQVETRLCGFGLVDATINTYREAQLAQPDSILLCGVAGTYDANLCPVGETICFRAVSQFGIGCQRDTFQLPTELGFSSSAESLTLQSVGDIPLNHRLVSVTGAGVFAVDQISDTYPDCVAEDMEGYGFALGAISCGIPQIGIVRAISNVVGQPFSEWSVQEALNDLGKTLNAHFQSVASAE